MHTAESKKSVMNKKSIRTRNSTNGRKSVKYVFTLDLYAAVET